MKNRFVFLLLFLFTFLPFYGQSAFDFISRNRNFSASNYCIYPDTIEYRMTPPPAGKKPFYISHYGRHGSRYLNSRKGYDIPYNMLCKVDSMHMLTELGRKVKQEIKSIIDDTEDRWGDLTSLGRQQHRDIARRMMERFPEVFSGKAYVDARSTTVNRCILSMGEAVQQMLALNPRLQVTMQASKRDMNYMNYQDSALRSIMETDSTRKAFKAFSRSRERNPRLMNLLFTNADSVVKVIDEAQLNYYILKTGLIQQNISRNDSCQLVDLFTYEELHQYWQMENAWWYFTYGPSPINGSRQPYTQRYLLRQLIADADSCIHQPRHGAQLRFGHETVILPLTCLLGINGFDAQIDDLELLEPSGWWACLVFPMASNIQFVFYRSDVNDRDIIFKVLLNEEEARLPLLTDIAPYYHWSDFRDYYLLKLDAYSYQTGKKEVATGKAPTASNTFSSYE